MSVRSGGIPGVRRRLDNLTDSSGTVAQLAAKLSDADTVVAGNFSAASGDIGVFDGTDWVNGQTVATVNIGPAGTAQILGTGADAADAVGADVGSNVALVTAGAKCVRFRNATNERGNVDKDGNLSVNMLANGQVCAIKSLTELTTIAAAASTDTVIQLPAHALIIGVSPYVETVIPDAATLNVGTAATADLFVSGLSTAQGSSIPGTKAGVVYNASAVAIRFTPNVSPTAATGKVRVTIHYIQVTAATS